MFLFIYINTNLNIRKFFKFIERLILQVIIKLKFNNHL